MGFLKNLVKGVMDVQKEAVKAQKELSGEIFGGNKAPGDESFDSQDSGGAEEDGGAVNRSSERETDEIDKNHEEDRFNGNAVNRPGEQEADEIDENYEEHPNYQGEIDLADFVRRGGKGGLRIGDIYKIRADFSFSDASFIDFHTQDSGAIGFALVQRAPKLKEHTRYAFYCKVSNTTPIFLKAEGAVCAYCGAAIDAGVDFCPNCGKERATEFCGNCGAPIAEEALICPSCNTPLYEQLDFTELASRENQFKRRFISLVRYFGREGSNIALAHPEELNIVFEFRTKVDFPEMAVGQKALVYYSSKWKYDQYRHITGVEVQQPPKQLPVPPPEYQEIDGDIFLLNQAAGKYRKGDRFWSRLFFKKDEVSSVQLLTPKGKAIGFDLTVPLPEIKGNPQIIVLYRVIFPYTQLFESAILYDTWLLPPPVPKSQLPVEEISLSDFKSLLKSLADFEIRKFKFTAFFCSKSSVFFRFADPQEKEITLFLDSDRFRSSFSELIPGQTVALCLICYGRDKLDIVIDSCEVIRPPKAPEGYEEIDVDDFALAVKAGKRESGHKFSTLARFHKTAENLVTVIPCKNPNALALNIRVQRDLPRMEVNQLVRVLYTLIIEDGNVVVDLDDVLL
jgi:RNA polymerase subunit RPABC4/transcription elongation factor Spt4